MIKIKNKQTNQILAIFDSLKYIKKHNDFSYLGNDYNIDDIKKAQAFLLAYQGSLGTFNAYRREIERLLQWCALVVRKSLNNLRREDIEDYIKLSVELAKNVDKYNELKNQLKNNLKIKGIGTNEIYTKNLEKAFEEVYMKKQKNLPNENLYV